MSSSTKETRKVLEGVLAINKPQWASSAGVLRDLQTHFDKSSLFAPWLDLTRRNMTMTGSKQKHINRLKVKMGHGGTLDPLATGVLIVGVGKGTKCLQRFLMDCTKTYECVVLFGVATDSYDAVGKIVSRAPYEHVTKELVEEKLEQFRGKIMQKPSIFSALKVDGKKMYEYARAGGEVPDVPARPVEAMEMEMMEWLEPGTHEYTWPKEEMDSTEMAGAEKLMGIRKEDAEASAKRSRKRSRSPDGLVTNSDSLPKKPRTESEPAMSGALPVRTNANTAEAETETKAEPMELADDSEEPSNAAGTGPTEETDSPPAPQPPAARLRMTVTSGFYVRSLCHDLGLACNSLGLMSSLVRSRQGNYELGKNVLEYSDFEAGPETWEPKVQAQLEKFMEEEGWEAEEVEDEEEWKAKRKEMEEKKKERDRERSDQGGRRKNTYGPRHNGGWKRNNGNDRPQRY